tara:strand:+ start:182 stop:295 length:114 start_codon:yes stop_codon:yes gene_type:complete
MWVGDLEVLKILFSQESIGSSPISGSRLFIEIKYEKI